MDRIDVLKTYKLFIGGAFPRTESGRYEAVRDKKGNLIANICMASRKDFRNAVVAARKAQEGWNKTTQLLKGQVLYRIAEMLESRKVQFVDELVRQGLSKKAAEKEVELSVDRLVYYAGWSDKFQQIFSSVNPVNSSHFNFSVLEPMGVVAVIAPENDSLLGLISILAPAIVGGNTVVLLASETKPLCSISFAEVLNTSDVPAGVVNILTGKTSEISPQMASHMDINAVVYCGNDENQMKNINELASENVKRVVFYKKQSWDHPTDESPYFIEKLQEVKTTWHPIKI